MNSAAPHHCHGTARSPSRRQVRGLSRWTGVGVALLALSTAHTAQAQQAKTAPVEPGARGTLGGLVLGAEVALLLEAALKIRPLWAYGVGAGVGAVGGALTGFASDEAGNTELSMGFLVGAIVLAIPTTVAVLQATSYHAPSLNDGAERSRSGPLIALHVRPSPTSFLGEYHQDSLAIGVPDVKVSQVYSSTERATYRLPSATQVLVPVLQVSF